MDQVNPKGSSSLLVTGGSYIFNKNEKVIVILNLDFTTDAWIIRSFSSLSLEKFANSPIRQFANSPIRQFAKNSPIRQFANSHKKGRRSRNCCGHYSLIFYRNYFLLIITSYLFRLEATPPPSNFTRLPATPASFNLRCKQRARIRSRPMFSPL